MGMNTYLLSKEVLHTGTSNELWKLGGVSKCIGKPARLASFTKIAFEETLTLQELSNKRLPRGVVAVEFHPRLVLLAKVGL